MAGEKGSLTRADLVWKVTRAAVVVLALTTGCANPGAAEREESSRDFQTNLVAETERVLAEVGGELTLSNAVSLAHERTLKLAQQDLETKLARITRATMFSAFLPTVAFSGNEALFSGRISGLPQAGSLETSGAHFGSGTMLVAQPVFTPVAWIMFAETQYGVRIKDIVRDRAEQVMDIQVAALFYRAAVAERTVRTYELQLASAAALTNRLARLAAEGYALAADRARAEARYAVDAARLVQARNERAETCAALADILRLWPLATFAVKGDSLLELPALPEKPLEEWVWDGLVTRKDLYASDQLVELRKARVIEALASFLPNVVLGGGGANLSLESVAVRGWAGSLMGTWAAFEGFRSIQQYRAARAEREAEFKLHEDRMLAVVVAVANAYRNLLFAREQATAARIFAAAARMDHAATERRYADGQETLSVVLDKLVVRDEAEVKAVQAAYGEALAAIQLRQAVGLDLFASDRDMIK